VEWELLLVQSLTWNVDGGLLVDLGELTFARCYWEFVVEKE
jgi:hypothetical protein